MFRCLATVLFGLLLPLSVAAHDFGGPTISDPPENPPSKCPKGDCCGGGGGPPPGGPPPGGGPPPPGGDEPPFFTFGSGGDPIWFYDGRLTLSYSDLAVGNGFPVRLQRRYDSSSQFDTGLGYGWAFDHDLRLFEYPDGAVMLRTGCGRRDRFAYTGGAFVTPTDGVQGELVQLANGTYTFTRSDAQRHHFDAEGRLTAVEERSGWKHEFTYDARGVLPLSGTSKHSVDPTQPMVVAYQPRLTRIAERSPDGQLTGAAIDFYYDDTSGRLTHVIASDGRRLDYAHDAVHGNLTGVTGLTDFAQSFTYADPNDAHNLTTLVNGSGATPVVTTYDVQDRATRQVQGEEVMEIAYPSATTRSVTWRIQDAAPRVHSFQFQGTDLIKETNAVGHELRQTFNAQRDLVRRELWQNSSTLLQATDWTYDAQGRRLTESVTLDSGEVVTHARTYDHGWVASEQTTSSASAQVFRTEYSFERNVQGVPVNVTQVKRKHDDGSFATTTYSYCTAADMADPSTGCPYERLLKAVDGPRTDVNDVTTVTYYTGTDLSGCGAPSGACYQKGALQRATNALSHATEILAYDANGRPARVQDPNGVVTRTTYHVRGWPLTRTMFGADPNSGADDATAAGAFDARGNLISLTDPDGVTTTYVYTGRNWLTEIQDGAGGRLAYTLDKEGHLTKEEVFDAGNTLVRTRSYGYDVQGRRTTERDAQNRVTTTEYDAAGRVTRIADALGTRTDHSYDDLGRLTQTKDDAWGLQATTQFAYDAVGNLRSVTDPKGLVTSYTYNAWDQLTTLQSPDTGTTSYTYDAADNHLTQTDARGVTATYAYDALGRLTGSVHGAGAQTVTFAYDQPDATTSCAESSPLGRLTTMTDPSGSTVVCYDRRGNATRKLQTVNGVAQMLVTAYTLGDRIVTMTYPSGAVVGYSRDAQGRIAAMSKDGSPLIATTGYRPFGPLSGLTWASGATQSWTYDANDWIDAIGGTALNLDYSTDAVGNISALAHADPAQARTFEYDRLSRLTAVKNGSNAVLESYGYDATGNRLSKSAPGLSQTYTYPGTSHRLSGISGITHSYDAMGSLADRGDGWTFEYDARQRLQYVKQGGTLRQTNTYNGRGERVRKQSATADAHYLYDDAGRLLAETNGAGQAQKDYLWLDDQPVALLPHVGAYASEPLAIHSDHLGTPRAVTRPNGTTVWTWPLTSAAFGETVPAADPDGDSVALEVNLRFPGQYFDVESGLHYNYFRDYEPDTGRYVESDPIGLDWDISTYSYAVANPIAVFDETGEAGHRTNKRKSSLPKHQAGDRRRKQDRGNEKGDKERRQPRKRPPGYKGEWPPKDRPPKGPKGSKGFIDPKILAWCSRVSVHLILITTPRNVGQGCDDDDPCDCGGMGAGCPVPPYFVQ